MIIRAASAADVAFLREMLYLALFVPRMAAAVPSRRTPGTDSSTRPRPN
jgi:hypothetical protein